MTEEEARLKNAQDVFEAATALKEAEKLVREARQRLFSALSRCWEIKDEEAQRGP